MDFRKSLFILASLAGSATAFADPLALASVFSDNGVIQRDLPAPIWGVAAPNATVEVKLEKDGAIVFEVATAADDAGKWLAKTEPISAGGPYSLYVSSKGEETIALTNLLFGDVWICSGQSNMEMSYSWGLTRGKEDMENDTYPEIRLLNVPNKTSVTPVDTFSAKWAVCTPEAAKRFSACGYFFGAALKKELQDVPIGLIDVTWSGTYIQTWLSMDSIAKVDALADSVQERRKMIADWNEGGSTRFAVALEEWTASLDPLSSAPVKPFVSAFDDSDWKTVLLPQSFEKHIHAQFDGVVWYRLNVTLTAEQAAAGATISLGKIDDDDDTYINGIKVGSTHHWETERLYRVPADVLKAGDNLITVRIFDSGGGGGFASNPESLILKVGSDSLSLAQEWKYSETAVSGSKKPEDLTNPNANSYSACYNGMFMPIFPLAVKGAIWYQGCSNVGDEVNYFKLFNAMIDDWRTNLSGGDFPIYLVQLAAFRETQETPRDSAWARMRWVMTQLGETVKHSGTAVAIDIGHHTDIHPKDKKTVGERLARLALNRTYERKDIVEAGPIPVGVTTSDNGLVVAFKNATGLKTSDGAAVSGFQVVDATGNAEWTQATINGETVLVTIPDGMEALTVRFAWDDYPICNLVNAEDLPCGPFQLDVK